jgi:hypothetical protein
MLTLTSRKGMPLVRWNDYSISLNLQHTRLLRGGSHLEIRLACHRVCLAIEPLVGLPIT